QQGDVGPRAGLCRSLPRATARLAARSIARDPVRTRQLGGARGPGEQAGAARDGSLLLCLAERLQSAARRQRGVVAALRRCYEGSEAASVRAGRVAPL